MTEVDNHAVFFLNYFTSYQLVSGLSDRNIRVSGTVRENRTNHCTLKPKKLLKIKIVVLSTVEVMAKFDI